MLVRRYAEIVDTAFDAFDEVFTTEAVLETGTATVGLDEIRNGAGPSSL